jgi:polyhydroxyalkanoate synthesis regulator protein
MRAYLIQVIVEACNNVGSYKMTMMLLLKLTKFCQNEMNMLKLTLNHKHLLHKHCFLIN